MKCLRCPRATTFGITVCSDCLSDLMTPAHRRDEDNDAAFPVTDAAPRLDAVSGSSPARLAERG